ncbi:MAG: hypothetical protein QNL14_17450 [Deltaproteobacteria bacterium]|nr:hypothetical protein [Deltaproteobacteria bacterium]
MMVCLLKGIEIERVQILANVTEEVVDHPAVDLPAVEDQAVEEDQAAGVADQAVAVAVGEMQNPDFYYLLFLSTFGTTKNAVIFRHKLRED